MVIAGGGVAALEALMALRDLAGDRVEVTLAAPVSTFETKALRTAEPFAVDRVTTRGLPEVAQALGATFELAGIDRVDAAASEVTLSDGRTLGYDALVVAVGAQERPAYEHALIFGTRTGDTTFNGLLADLEGHYSRSVGFVVAPGVTWPLPIYELALMTAGQVRSMGIDDVRLALITPESTPLAAFGRVAGEEVGRLLEEAGVEFHGDAYAEIPANGRVLVRPGEEELRFDRVVALPVLEGRRIEGLPADEHGFVPVDDHGRVRGLEAVYAAGDGTDFPIKQGGLACQQADAVAEHIAAAAGADVEPQPFRPVLRGKLLTGRSAEYLRNPIAGGGGDGDAWDAALWFPPTKVSGRYLSAWLAEEEVGAAPDQPAGEVVDVQVELPQ